MSSAALWGERYRSIFLAENWAHQTYFGWTVVCDRPELRILKKKYGFVSRYLVMVFGRGQDLLSSEISQIRSRIGAADIIIHDFDDVLTASPLIAGLRFRPAEQHERLLNIKTFVIDLAKSDAELLAQMSADYRRKIRKAQAAGIVIEANHRPDVTLVDRFAHALREFAAERGIQYINPNTLAAMYRDGRGLLLVARKGGEIINYLHLYLAGDAASFMYGVNPSKENDGAGQLLQFEAMRKLKAEKIRWYDMGGVVTSNPLDGIYSFKKKFGGELVDLGAEWRHTGVVALAGGCALTAAKQLAKLGTR